jgi:uncharacterized YccA/Bax inhibitor family protein
MLWKNKTATLRWWWLVNWEGNSMSSPFVRLIGLVYSAAGILTGLLLDQVLNQGRSAREPFVVISLCAVAGLMAWNLRMYIAAFDDYSPGPGAIIECFFMPMLATFCFLFTVVMMFVV